MRDELETDLPADPEDCLHPNRPANPRVNDEGKPWHCLSCDTLFIVEVRPEPAWREL